MYSYNNSTYFQGMPLTDHEMVDIHYDKMGSLQVSPLALHLLYVVFPNPEKIKQKCLVFNCILKLSLSINHFTDSVIFS